MRQGSWVSRWHALFHKVNDGDIASPIHDFQNPGIAKSSNAKSSLLLRSSNPFKGMSRRWQPKISLPPSRFEVLPPEVILKIAQYLSLSGSLSLSYTCRRFRQTVETRVEDLEYLIEIQSFLKDLKESEDERRMVRERLAFLCMLERDGRLSTTKAVCGGCKTVHSISFFSSTALQRRPHQRLCTGREGRLWICPHRIWDHGELREAQKQCWKATESMAQCGCPNGEVLFSSRLIESPAIEEYSLSIYYPILAMPQASAFHTDSMKQALRDSGVSICPHLRLGDRKTLGAFHTGCPRLANPWLPGECAKCVSRKRQSAYGVEVNCESCKTRTAFYLSESGDETTTLWARASRCISKSAGSITEPRWIDYLYTPADFQRLQEEWQASSMRRSPHTGEQVGGKIGTKRQASRAW